jgi:probable F420-dependent oxidoreductase
MRFGFYLPTRGPGATPDGLKTFVTRAEALGFNSVMIADHIVFPVKIESKYPYTVSGEFPGHGDAMEQLTLMSYIAALTSRLRLVSSVMIVPHRNPILTAKALSTIDVLSGGRVTVGVGVGWLREEFEALDTPPFDQRGASTDEYLRIFKNLWTEEPASYEGEFYRYEALRFQPKPVQRPHPPIWIGGHSMPALRRVARLGDGWHPVGATPASPLPLEEVVGKLEILKGLMDKEGRDFQALDISYKAPIYDVTIRQTETERRPFTGAPEQIVEDIQTFKAAGISELIFDFRGETITESIDRMESFKNTIMHAAT